MSIDSRLMERRRTVAEQMAKRSMARLLKFLAFAVFSGSIVWALFSPWLSVSEVETTGVSQSETHSILAEQGVVEGAPTISIRRGAALAALARDPWVAEAEVVVRWPDLVTVSVVERTPLAWVKTSEGWARRALDGVALPSGDTPDGEMARVEMPALSNQAAPDSIELAGALTFIQALPVRLHPGTIITVDDGELWATVTGYQVRLGRAVEMKEKALSLDALLDESIPEGSLLVLIAPTNPAVMTPTPDEPDSSEDTGDSAP